MIEQQATSEMLDPAPAPTPEEVDETPVSPALPDEPQDDVMVDAGEGQADVEGRQDRPEGVPEKFWDPQTGALRTEALLKSYLELERKLGGMIAVPAGGMDIEGNQRLRKLIGVPEAADDYCIEPMDERLQPDSEINARLHEAGFTQRQAQLVYDLAAEHMLPAIDGAMSEAQAARDVERLESHFGGAEAWQSLCRQIKTWAKANLPEDATEVLSSSFEGVLAMHQMMQANEPAVVHQSEGGSQPKAADLAALMRDPRYWRDRDPALVAQVTEGFKRLYPS